MKTKKRIIAFLLIIGMLFSIQIPLMAKDSGYNLISQKEYEVSPGVKEYEIFKNEDSMNNQQAIHVMEVDMSSGYATLAVGYNDCNIENIKSGNGWGMEKATVQAQNMQSRRGVNVVGAINGDFFNMANGQPSGTVIMNGEVIQNNYSYGWCFWIDSNNAAHISAGTAAMYAESSALGVTIKEAIGAPYALVSNGQAVYNEDASPNPRTAIGIKADGTVVMFMVNGRQAPYSAGMTLDETAREMVDLGCVTALNLDGGGSSTFATQRAGDEENNVSAGLTVRCSPSDGYERSVSDTLMVISNVQKTGEFDHAVIAPYEEIYTPGSAIQFTAKGIDIAGSPAALPAEGLSWLIKEGASLGSIDTSGKFTGNSGAVGVVTVALLYNGNEVGTTSIELRWPDSLSFTNNSVSLDFGASSNLSFNPTYMGRKVNYKDGDFVWSLVDNSELVYKYTTLIETKAANASTGYAGNNVYDFTMSLTGKLGAEQVLVYSAYGTWKNRSTAYVEKAGVRTINTDENGFIKISSTVQNTRYWTYEYIFDDSNKVIGQTETAHTETLQADQTFVFSVGKISNNIFTADETSSLRGVMHVTLAGNTSVSGDVNVVVGMEPLVIMDFEDCGSESAEDYWAVHNGASKVTGSMGQLTINEINAKLLWIRSATDGTLKFDGTGVVSSSENSNVRFGDHAMKFCWDMSHIPQSGNVAAELGFSSGLLVNSVQPTKIGMWVYVPQELSGDNSQIKAILVGNAHLSGSDSAKLLSYRVLNEDGSISITDYDNYIGTTTYFQYMSYDANGNVTGSTLSDWAGKGWTWIETDISSLQFPISIQRGYTVRVTSPPNATKGKGYILIDNLQLIYGTNTNDINNPVIENVTEKTTGTAVSSSSVPTFTTNAPGFDVAYNDSELTDKYATSVSANGVKVTLDGVDITNGTVAGGQQAVEINKSSIYIKTEGLVNGTHVVVVKLKDNYGNETTERYFFNVNVENSSAKVAQLRIKGQTAQPGVGKPYSIDIINNASEKVDNVSIVFEVSPAYMANGAYTIMSSMGYRIDKVLDYDKNTITLNITAENDEPDTPNASIATIKFNIPTTAKPDDKFVYTVLAANYSVGTNPEYFALSSNEIAITADYTITVDRAIKGLPSVMTVKDNDGNTVSGAKVYLEGALIGTTGNDGKLTYTFDVDGRKTLYASFGEGRSWDTNVVVNVIGTDATAMNKIQNNASADGSTTKAMTWLSLIGSTDTANTVVRYSQSAETVAEGTVVDGTNEIITFTEATTGVAYRLNKVCIKNLEPGTVYYYQVGDGTTWTETLSFTTAPEKASNNVKFFVFGDIQTDNTANLESAINKVSDKQSGNNYAFGIQTGDAIDAVNVYGNWRSYYTVMNGQKLGSIDIIHTLGNHEYYGDTLGAISGNIYSLPKSSAGSWYAVEYGIVYVAVINNGTREEKVAALTEIKNALASEPTSCTWKVLTLHEPIYGTNEEMPAEERLELTNLIDDIGFDVVFTGDDHAYARTSQMKGDVKVTDEYIGTTYYVSGDLSNKDNAYNTHDYFECSVPHSTIGDEIGYGGMYISVSATDESITIDAIKLTSEGTETIDTFKRYRSVCTKEGHKYTGSSIYNTANGNIKCAICQAEASAAEKQYTGVLMSTSEYNVLLVNGVLKTSGFTTIGNDVYYSNAEGRAYTAQKIDPRTCVTGGKTIYKCDECSVQEQVGDYLLPNGHQWARDSITTEYLLKASGHRYCTVCGAVGKDITEGYAKFGTVGNPRADDSIPNYAYKSGGIRPSSFVTMDGGKTALESSNDDNVNSSGHIKDTYVSWINSTTIGAATVKYEGRGDYYGVIELTYTISPGNVTGFTSQDIASYSATLKWDAVAGAQSYKVYKYNADKSSRVLVADNITTNSCLITGLEEKTTYYFVIRAYAVGKDVDGNDKVYSSAQYSDVLTVTTVEDSTKFSSTYIKTIGAKVSNQSIKSVLIDGKYYLFMPSNTDLSNVTFDFGVSGTTDSITLTGNNGNYTMSSYTSGVNLTSISGKNADGTYKVSVKIGDRKEIEVYLMKSSSVSSVYIQSDKPEENRTWVDSNKENVATGLMTFVDANGNIIYSDALKQIKARGNSTFTYYSKKAYQIKLKTATDLIGCGEDVKTWVLLANYGDATMMHDKLMKDLANELGMVNVANCSWVDLYYDGEYRGTYLISEKVSVGSTGVDITDMEDKYSEINVDYGKTPVIKTENIDGKTIKYTEGLTEPANITGGYLIELNKTTIDEANGFITVRGKAFNLKSPEFCGKDALSYISSYYQAFEDAVYNSDNTGYNAATGKYYYEYCDLQSLVKVFLLQEFALNPDGFISSVYFYKDAGGIMYAGPIWDQDMTLGTGWTKYISSSITDYHYLAEALIKIPSFRSEVERVFNETMLGKLEALTKTEGAVSSYYSTLSDSVAMNYKLWPMVRVGNPNAANHLWADGTSYETVINDMTSWINARIAGLKTRFDGSEIEKLKTSDSSEMVITEEENGEMYLRNTKDQLTVNDVLSNFTNASSRIEIIKANDDYDYVGTGSIIRLYDVYGNTVIDEITVIVSGDLNGDGEVSSNDYVRVKANYRGDLDLSDLANLAADINGDGEITANDYVRIKAYYQMHD